jgi:diguanylate cyclase (GGDEF)-like protein
MNETTLDTQTAVRSGEPVPEPSHPRDPMYEALTESRLRWRSLVSLASDLAFETDARGRFVFVLPDTALGWPPGSLIGQPSELLLGDDGAGTIFNPFLTTVDVRRRRVWLRRYDGTLSIMAVSAAPLTTPDGTLTGARGIAIDLNEYDTHSSQIAGRLRRGQVIDLVLSRVAQEVTADRMMQAALWAMIHAMGAEGAAVVAEPEDGGAAVLLREVGPGAAAVLDLAGRLTAERGSAPTLATNLDGRFVITVGCLTRNGTKAGLAIWRNADSRPWDTDDTQLIGSAVTIIRMILEYESIQEEMAHQARTDPLTGLLNRRAFLEEMQRHVSRLDRENLAGTLMFVDMDGLKAVNDRFGHAAGDAVLAHLADMLRNLVRPSDLIARLGGDEFAVWMSGADHMTAAERAHYLCKTVPIEMHAVLDALEPGKDLPDTGVSIGIAKRRAGSEETIDELTRRADLAMYEVKRGGRGHWRVSLLDGD